MSALFDLQFLRRLERLSLLAQHVRAGQLKGERRSTKRGTSVEFADYRDYARGDDLRRVDWNIYARLERPFVKLFEEEEDLAVHLLLDGSTSMDWGGGEGESGQDENKWVYARRLAAALGHVALVSGDRLTVALLRGPGQAPLPPFGPHRGRGHTLRLLQWLEAVPAQGSTDLNAGLRASALSAGRAGLVVLISDLFSPNGYTEGLTALAGRGHEIVVLHLLTRDEVEPPLAGDLRLLDAETGQAQEVSIDGGTRGLYRHRLEAWRTEIAAACHARGVHYLPVETDTPFDRVVLHDLRRGGVLK